MTRLKSRTPAAAWAGGLAAAGLALVADRVAVAATPPASRWRRRNHANQPVTLLEGPAAVAAVLVGTVLEARLGAPPRRAAAVALAAAGAGVVGGYDDLYGSTSARGLAGHLRALRGGTVTSGLVKVVGVGATALAAVAVLGTRDPVDLAVDGALVAGTANLVNLFDLRPGRAAKVVLLVAGPLGGVGAAPAVGAAAGSLPSDLQATSMLGDCGANALGAAVAVAAVAGLPRWARRVALAGVVGLTLASERVSFSAVIDASPVLRRLDRLGRAAATTRPPDPAA